MCACACACVHVCAVCCVQGREVQQRLVAQRQKSAARAFAAKTTRNVSKARGKKAKDTKSALAEW